jgi:hypothetical protein
VLFIFLVYSVSLSLKSYFAMTRNMLCQWREKMLSLNKRKNLYDRRKCPKPWKSSYLQIDMVRIFSLCRVETSSYLSSLHSGIWNVWHQLPDVCLPLQTFIYLFIYLSRRKETYRQCEPGSSGPGRACAFLLPVHLVPHSSHQEKWKATLDRVLEKWGRAIICPFAQILAISFF